MAHDGARSVPLHGARDLATVVCWGLAVSFGRSIASAKRDYLQQINFGTAFGAPKKSVLLMLNACLCVLSTCVCVSNLGNVKIHCNKNLYLYVSFWNSSLSNTRCTRKRKGRAKLNIKLPAKTWAAQYDDIFQPL